MFCDRLKYIRKHQELSQAEAAKALKIHPVTYNRYECGQREPDFATLKRIAVFFHVSLDYLLGNDFAEAEEIIDLDNFVMHGNYTINAHFPAESERRMLRALFHAVYDNQEK